MELYLGSLWNCKRLTLTNNNNNLSPFQEYLLWCLHLHVCYSDLCKTPKNKLSNSYQCSLFVFFIINFSFAIFQVLCWLWWVSGMVPWKLCGCHWRNGRRNRFIYVSNMCPQKESIKEKTPFEWIRLWETLGPCLHFRGILKTFQRFCHV